MPPVASRRACGRRSAVGSEAQSPARGDSTRRREAGTCRRPHRGTFPQECVSRTAPRAAGPAAPGREGIRPRTSFEGAVPIGPPAAVRRSPDVLPPNPHARGGFAATGPPPDYVAAAPPPGAIRASLLRAARIANLGAARASPPARPSSWRSANSTSSLRSSSARPVRWQAGRPGRVRGSIPAGSTRVYAGHSRSPRVKGIGFLIPCPWFVSGSLPAEGLIRVICRNCRGDCFRRSARLLSSYPRRLQRVSWRSAVGLPTVVRGGLRRVRSCGGHGGLGLFARPCTDLGCGMGRRGASGSSIATAFPVPLGAFLSTMQIAEDAFAVETAVRSCSTVMAGFSTSGVSAGCAVPLERA